MEFEYKGYKLVQSSFNWHYSIYDSNNHKVMHAQYDKVLTKEKAIEIIEAFLTMFDQE